MDESTVSKALSGVNSTNPVALAVFLFIYLFYLFFLMYIFYPKALFAGIKFYKLE